MSDIQKAFIDDIAKEIPAAASEGAPDYYDLDDHHRFMKDEPLSVCGNIPYSAEEVWA